MRSPGQALGSGFSGGHPRPGEGLSIVFSLSPLIQCVNCHRDVHLVSGGCWNKPAGSRLFRSKRVAHAKE